MPVTPEVCLVLRAEPSHSHSITSQPTKVRILWYLFDIDFLILLAGEKARIQAAGGFVDFGRVNGNLALSRAIGDFEFKKSAELSPEQQIVTAYPDVTVHDIAEDDEFLVVACDGKFPSSWYQIVTDSSGIWDCQSSQAVVEFVRRGIASKQDLEKICENMMDNCLASNSETGGVGCDNMTMAIIGILGGKTKEEWYDTIAKRVANGEGPCAPPEYGKSMFNIRQWLPIITAVLAEFRGPGVHHNFDDSDSGYDMDMSHQGGGFGSNSRGRIILLGDGSEVLTSSDDTEMFDQSDEDKDLASQVPKGETSLKSDAIPEKLETPPKAEYKGAADEKKDDSKTD
jgi:protein phosphatase 2C family protein 2/3